MYNILLGFLFLLFLLRARGNGPPQHNLGMKAIILASLFGMVYADTENPTTTEFDREESTNAKKIEKTFQTPIPNEKVYMKLTISREHLDELEFRNGRIYEVQRNHKLSLDILFLFCGVFILETVHFIILDMFIRLTKTRFQNHKRFKIYANAIMILIFFILILNMMLVIIFYRGVEMFK
ncbi:hypothetical protein JTB14_017447 [Gonioctena quinquepunctata]|nr:hypothetical protein JTB14_017447 [Gonioctena quinquepunctata]